MHVACQCHLLIYIYKGKTMSTQCYFWSRLYNACYKSKMEHTVLWPISNCFCLTWSTLCFHTVHTSSLSKGAHSAFTIACLFMTTERTVLPIGQPLFNVHWGPSHFAMPCLTGFIQHPQADAFLTKGKHTINQFWKAFAFQTDKDQSCKVQQEHVKMCCQLTLKISRLDFFLKKVFVAPMQHNGNPNQKRQSSKEKKRSNYLVNELAKYANPLVKA